MAQRSFKAMFVELVSFLTLFALIGSMSANFWERYLIQSEIAKMKTSLHILKETIFDIESAYDKLHYDLKELSDKKGKQSRNSIVKDLKISSRSDHLNNIGCGEEGEHLSRIKGNINTIKPKEPDNGIKYLVQNATTATRNSLKSTAVNSDRKVINNKLSKNIYKKKLPETNDINTQVHKCCKDARCCQYTYN